MIVVLMAVTGSGKTTVGKVLATELGWKFHDADDYHPPANIEKMRRGIPLTDEDRKPWLQTLARLIDDARDRGESIVLACSPLKHAYQEYLRHHLDAARLLSTLAPLMGSAGITLLLLRIAQISHCPSFWRFTAVAAAPARWSGTPGSTIWLRKRASWSSIPRRWMGTGTMVGASKG